MASTSISVTNQFLTSTMYSYVKELQSTIDSPNRFLDYVEKKGKEEEEGGERMIIPFKFIRHSSTTQLSTGYEPIDLDVNPLGVPGSEQWGDWIRPVVISGHEERINRGGSKIFSILESRVKDTVEGFRAEFEQQALIGNVAAMSDMLTFNGIDYSDGFLEEPASGSQDNTIHGLSRATATYQTEGFENARYDVADSFSANGLLAMYDTTIRTRKLVGDLSKHHWWASISLGNNIKRALNSNERYLSEKELDAGRMVMTYSGIPIEFVDLPNAGTNTTGNPVSAFLIDHGKIKWVGQKGYHFKSGEFDKQPGYDTRASFMHLMGQWRGTYFGSSAVLHSGETWA